MHARAHHRRRHRHHRRLHTLLDRRISLSRKQRAGTNGRDERTKRKQRVTRVHVAHERLGSEERSALSGGLSLYLTSAAGAQRSQGLAGIKRSWAVSFPPRTARSHALEG